MATYNLATQTVSTINTGDVINCSYTGSVKNITLPIGVYRLECWGAAGQYTISDYNNDNYAQYYSGGYAAGTLTLRSPQSLYIAVGETAFNKNRTNTGMFNGGGAKYGNSDDNGLGGGATHISTLAHTFSTDSYRRQIASSDGLLSRILVAGGGGSGRATSNESMGGYIPAYAMDGSYCGKLNSAGSSSNAASGGFGYGDTCTSTGDTNSSSGGGWYGGGATSDSYGGGGSSFAWCEEYASYVPSGWKISTSLYLTDVKFYCGLQNMPSFTNNSTMLGNQKSDGYCRITCLSNEIPLDLAYDTLPSTINVGDVFNCSYSGSAKSITLPKGQYLLKCWGAQGGTYNTMTGGYGGYSKGIISLKESTLLYLYVGGKGSSSSITGGWNGGGNGVGTYGRGGGGATDIRIKSTDLKARVIVAGGGGGAGSSRYGGPGGGLNGGDGYYFYTDGTYPNNYQGKGGTQTEPGYGYTASYAKGAFGTGGTARAGNSGGGGGGWYGGGGCYTNNYGGGGGSGYVYTEDSASIYPSGCLLTDDYFLEKASTVADTTFAQNIFNEPESGKTGNGFITIICISKDVPDINKLTLTSNNSIPASSITEGTVISVPYSGAMRSIKLPKGKYRFECWGAQGGSYNSFQGGYGGYSKGNIEFTDNETQLYLYVGGKGGDNTTYTGGFNGGGTSNYASYDDSTQACGGGGGTDIRIAQDSLYARVIVAGGGGGATERMGTNGTTGCGGGLTGGSYDGNSGGGTQTSGGAGNYATGAFGQGGSYPDSIYNNYRTGAGGGGWYGGGINSSDSYSATYYGPGGGGSGYVYTSSTASNYPSGCLLTSKYYLSSAETKIYTKTGNGSIKITRLFSDWSDGTSSSGTNITIPPEKDTYDLGTTTMPDRVKTGDIILCPYSGDKKKITLQKGIYKLECWGAQGGNGYYASSTTSRETSYGAYAKGILTLQETTDLYLYSGGAGAKYSKNNTGGFNGGGGCNGVNGNRYMNAGGGASDIRIAQDSLYARVIVAGGGGGCNESQTPVKFSSSAGSEIGFSGDNVLRQTGDYTNGGGGGQSSGGKSRTYSSYDSQYINTNFKGRFGQGGGAAPGVSHYYVNGGGGGWYGGGAGGPNGGAGGGSSYVYSYDYFADYPSGCLLNVNNILTEAETIGGNEAMHSGNGYIKITVIKAGFEIQCEDRVGNASGTLLGTPESKSYEENSVANGSDWGSSTTRNAYYINYTYNGNYTTIDPVTAEGKVYRFFDLNKYTISYNANGGTGAPGNQTKTHGTNITLSSTTPTKADVPTGTVFTVTYDAYGGSVSTTSATSTIKNRYTFDKWNTKADGTGTAYSKGATFSVNADTTLYAKWNVQQVGDEITLPTPTKSGLTFNGWYDETGNLIGKAGDKINPTRNIKLTADWQVPDNLYYAYIYDGSNWNEYIPKIKDGTDFSQYSIFITK